jgi:arginine deiminase
VEVANVPKCGLERRISMQNIITSYNMLWKCGKSFKNINPGSVSQYSHKEFKRRIISEISEDHLRLVVLALLKLCKGVKQYTSQ